MTGVVLLDLETPLALSSVAIKLKGRAVTHFTVPRTVSNGKSSHTGECVLECVLPFLPDYGWGCALTSNELCLPTYCSLSVGQFTTPRTQSCRYVGWLVCAAKCMLASTANA